MRPENRYFLITYFLISLGCMVNNKKQCKLYKSENKERSMNLESKLTLHHPQHAEAEEIKKPTVCDLQTMNSESNFADMVSLMDNTATGPNDEEVYGGDMVMSEPLENFLHSKEEDYSGATPLEQFRWPNGKVYYNLDKSIPEEMKQLIQKGMAAWSDFSCIIFEPKNDHAKDYVQINHTSNGCFSQVGRVGGIQILALSDQNCKGIDIVTHEIGHTLGLLHEHQRPDRDEYVVVHEENIPEEYRRDYMPKLPMTLEDTPYDFGSIMHYELLSYIDLEKYQMTPKIPAGEAAFRNNHGNPSFYDYQMINRLYKCEEPCKSNPLTCKNGGMKIFTGSKKCICLCKENYEGTFCEIENEFKNCSDTLLSEREFASSETFPKLRWCVIWIQAPKGKKVAVTFSSEMDGGPCITMLKIRTQELLGDQADLIHCNNFFSGRKIVSKTKDLIFMFKTGNSGELGFDASVKFV